MTSIHFFHKSIDRLFLGRFITYSFTMGIEVKQIEHFVEEVQKEANVVVETLPVFNLLLVVGNPDRLIHNEILIQGVLTGQKEKYNIQIADDSYATPTDAEGKDLVIITDSVNAGTVLARFRDITQPVLLMERAIADDMQMADGGATRYTSSNGEINIIDFNNPFFENLGMTQNGAFQIFRENARVAAVQASQNAIILGERVGNNNQQVFFYYNSGDVGRNGFVFPGARFYLGFERTSSNINQTISMLLLNVISKIVKNEYSV